MANNVSWFFESAAERKAKDYQPHTSAFGAFQKDGVQTFDERFNDLYESYKDMHGIDIKRDLGRMVSDRSFMEQYKADLLEPVFEGFREMSPNDPHINSIIENVNTFWDTKLNSYTESASLTGFLPIATLEFPVLVKQFFSSILKDIIEVEAVKTPLVTKHIRTTYMVDNNTGDEYEYPKCLFDGTWERIWNATKGHPIRSQVVPFVDGRLWRYDIIGGLTDGTPGIDKLSFNFHINGVQVGTEVVRLPGTGITVEFSTGGTLLNGDLSFTTPGGVVVEDNLSGQVNFTDGTISMSSASGQVTGVTFEGYLSNEKNLRSASVREKRSIERISIEDGGRWNMPFSIEEIEDAAALLDMNYYNRMVDEIVKVQEMQECMTVIKFLNDEFAKYNGVASNIWDLEPMSMNYTVDLAPPVNFAGDPFKYISTVIQFRLKAIIHELLDLTKLEDLSFVIVANPRVAQLISEFTGWKVQSGSSIGGISVNNSYGIATDLGANIRIVATNIYDAYTVDPDPTTTVRELVMHIYGYPTSAEHISYRHLKYTSHLFTSQSQTAYQSPAAPAGAYNIVTATSRFKTFAIQGIQARLVLLHSNRIYGTAPARPPVVGAPWTAPVFPHIP